MFYQVNNFLQSFTPIFPQKVGYNFTDNVKGSHREKLTFKTMHD